jgi:hypothetical protein
MGGVTTVTICNELEGIYSAIQKDCKLYFLYMYHKVAYAHPILSILLMVGGGVFYAGNILRDGVRVPLCVEVSTNGTDQIIFKEKNETFQLSGWKYMTDPMIEIMGTNHYNYFIPKKWYAGWLVLRFISFFIQFVFLMAVVVVATIAFGAKAWNPTGLMFYILFGLSIGCLIGFIVFLKHNASLKKIYPIVDDPELMKIYEEEKMKQKEEKNKEKGDAN